MSLLEPFRFNALMHPWALLVLAAVAALLAAELFARPLARLSVSTGETLAGMAHGRRKAFRRVPAVLRALGLALLVFALARPVQGYEVRKDRADVRDIMLCVDVSGSMRAMDFVVDGQPRNRLYVTKTAVRDFVDSRKERSGDRYGLDRLGLILYGAYAWTQCPLTLDYGVFERELEQAVIAEGEAKSKRTAIGSAIGLAVSRLRKSEAESKVIILLTDGQNNAGELDPFTAAQLAKDYGIRVYTIGCGSPEGGRVVQQTLFGQIMGGRSEPIDEETLKRIAAMTGAKYYRATDTESLKEAYAEINKLETTEVEIGDYYEHDEGFLPYTVLGAVVLAASIFARRSWFEPIP